MILPVTPKGPNSISRAAKRYRYGGPMTGALPVATDACQAVSKRSVKIIAGDRYVSAKKPRSREANMAIVP